MQKSWRIPGNRPGASCDLSREIKQLPSSRAIGNPRRFVLLIELKKHAVETAH